MSDTLDDAAKKMKNSQQDFSAKAETTADHAEGKPSSETLNKAKEKVKDAFSWIFFCLSFRSLCYSVAETEKPS